MTRVDIAGVSVSYGRTVALDDLTCSLAPGQVTALVGPNGSGKSTLLGVVAGTNSRARGDVLLNGEPLRAMHPHQRAKRVGALRQHDVASAGLTVAELVGLGLPVGRRWSVRADDPARVRRALERVDLQHHADRDSARLSGGEVQRVLLARAIVHDPGLVLLDEPSNHLDVRHRFALMDLVRGLGVTVVVVMHDLELAARYADRVVVLDHGALVAEGDPRSALAPPILRSVFGVDGIHATGRDGEQRLLLEPLRADSAPCEGNV